MKHGYSIQTDWPTVPLSMARPGRTVSLIPMLCLLLCSGISMAVAETGLIDRSTGDKTGSLDRQVLITPDNNQIELDALKSTMNDVVRSMNAIIDSPMDTRSSITLPELTEAPVIEAEANTESSGNVEHTHTVDTMAGELQVQPEPPVDDTGTQPALQQANIPARLKHEQPDAIASVAVAGSGDPAAEVTHTVVGGFLKHSADGQQLADEVNDWACVEDTRNGLVWEVKSSDGGMRDKNNSYTWFDPGSDQLDGIADGGRCEGDIACDTHAYIEAINRQKLCGFDDWRLPTREEMLSLVTYSSISVVQGENTITIDPAYFPQALASWYWTSSSNPGNPDYAWYVLFRNGISLNDLKERPKHVRLVRGKREA